MGTLPSGAIELPAIDFLLELGPPPRPIPTTPEIASLTAAPDSNVDERGYQAVPVNWPVAVLSIGAIRFRVFDLLLELGPSA